MEEIWRNVQDYEGLYQISNLGRIKRLAYWHNVGIKNIKKIYKQERILKQSRDSSGYKQVCLTKNSKKKSYSIHKMMAIAFIPNLENKEQVNHKDGNKINNIIDNLEWCTYHENLRHAMNHDLRAIGEKHGAAKLKNDDVLYIYKTFKNGEKTIQQLCKMFNMSYASIRDITVKRYWKNLLTQKQD